MVFHPSLEGIADTRVLQNAKADKKRNNKRRTQGGGVCLILEKLATTDEEYQSDVHINQSINDLMIVCLHETINLQASHTSGDPEI